MSQPGYTNCSCCGRVYKSDGSEDWLWREDHGEVDDPEPWPGSDNEDWHHEGER